MKSNKLVITINKPAHEVFSFTITPPNSQYWIPDIVNEETNELPIKIGTVYKLTRKIGDSFEVTITEFKKDGMVVFSSTDQNYHCRYTYIFLDEKTSKLEYYEWMDRGELEEPFTQEVLQKLKEVIEKL